MSYLAEFAVWCALLYGAWRLFRWSKQLKRAHGMRWRRRCGFWFMWAPFLVWVGQLLTPESAELILLPLRALAYLKTHIDGFARSLLKLGEGQLTGVWQVAVAPLAYALVYGVAGWLIGWPLDRLRAKPEDDPPAEGTASQ